MSANVIRYDRLWLSAYIDRISEQRRLAQSLENRLEWKLSGAPPELQAGCREILWDARELSRSLKATESVLRDYLDNVRFAAIQLQRQCEELEI